MADGRFEPFSSFDCTLHGLQLPFIHFQKGITLSDDRSDPIREKIDRLGEKYKLWLVIPLVTSALTAIANFRAGISLFTFFVSCWIFIHILRKILKVTEKLLPNRFSPGQRKTLQEAGLATLFLGGCALIGVVLRGDNLLSNLVAKNTPGGMSLSFIDPTFAAWLTSNSNRFCFAPRLNSGRGA